MDELRRQEMGCTGRAVPRMRRVPWLHTDAEAPYAVVANILERN
jgi:hypothetical protein